MAKRKKDKMTKNDLQISTEKTKDRVTRKNNTMAKRKKDKMTKNDLQNSTEKTKDRVTRTPQKTSGELGCSGKVSSACSLVAPVVLLLLKADDKS